MKAATTEHFVRGSEPRGRVERIRRADARRRKSAPTNRESIAVTKKQEPAADGRQAATSNPLLVLISAPSGGGKTTLCRELLAARPDMLRAVTCTTRAPREGEREGVDYYFLDAASFLKRVQAGNFLEHATVYGNSYGVLKGEVLGGLRQGRDVLLNVDVHGAATIRQRAQEDPELKRALVTVFLTPPTLEVLAERLRRRGTDTPASMQKRLSVARQEIGQWKNFDYLLVSTTKKEDLRRTMAIVEAEKMRTPRVRALEF